MASDTTELPDMGERSGWVVMLARFDPRDLALRHQIGLAMLGLMALIPAALTIVQLAAVIGVLYLMAFAMSWDFVSGYTGQISLGHAMFFAVGGYGTTVLNLQHGISPLVSIPLAMLLAGLLGLLVGVPALRLRGPYLSLVTLIVPLIMLQLAILFSGELPYLAPDGLKGTGGFIISPDPIVGTQSRSVVSVDSFQTAVIADYYVSFALFVFVLGVLYGITRTDAGAVFTAIRENEDVVTAVGLTASTFKIFAFVVSGAAGGLAGAMFVHSTAGHPLPQLLLELRVSLQVIVMAVLGGMGTIVGAAVGAVFVAVLNELIGSIGVTIPLLGTQPSTLEPIPVFLLGVLVLLAHPEGILPGAISLGQRTLAGVRGEEYDSDAGDSPLEQVIQKYREQLLGED